jgi:hypothetical protein
MKQSGNTECGPEVLGLIFLKIEDTHLNSSYSK